MATTSSWRPEPAGAGARCTRRFDIGLNGLRLSFSLLDEEAIDEGVRRLAAAMRAASRTASAHMAP